MISDPFFSPSFLKERSKELQNKGQPHILCGFSAVLYAAAFYFDAFFSHSKK